MSRRFGARTVLNGVSLVVNAGEIHLVVGPNGSGKSTLARLGVGLLRPHKGTVRIAGADPRAVDEIRARLGFLGHESQLYDDLTPFANLRFAASLIGVPDPAAAARTALQRFDVPPDLATPVRRLSRGFVQRIALARSLVHSPDLIVWDEPLTGLDAARVDRTIAILEAERDRGAAIVLISHDLPELWRLQARVHVLGGGAIQLATDTTRDLADFRRQYGELVE
ncbi:MAG: ABC transporter ATP-binding protein [Gemmatimonadales bacterium]